MFSPLSLHNIVYSPHSPLVPYSDCPLLLQVRPDPRACENPVVSAEHGPPRARHENHGGLPRVWTHVQSRGIRLLMALLFLRLSFPFFYPPTRVDWFVVASASGNRRSLYVRQLRLVLVHELQILFAILFSNRYLSILVVNCPRLHRCRFQRLVC